ncbi:MAG: undecaprenyl-diphosphate phosphatase [Actinomycetota bacterium]|nr:undecaprenyl-diphosphate phosphatase [Actinomycetota bacterium]MDA3012289.1 undecaprenyl-diphosphate phosphatase [Actinomycetota bacterium]MDA3024802.1 undecaprenyl-diphosphate phosphatase [Actinomycetota bacterium]
MAPEVPMPLLHAIVLGIVQGLTEFLPISSSGHLQIVPWLFGWNDFDDAGVKKAFDVALHLGTLAAVVFHFRRDVMLLVRKGLSKPPLDRDGRLAWLLVLTAVPAALVGALFETWIDDELGTPFVIACSLVVFGLLLGWIDRRRRGDRRVEELSLRDALLVGGAQVLALNPGTSRSGVTMTAALALGYGREAAVRLSFLMSLPVIAGAGAVKVAGLVSDGVPDGLLVPMLVGIATAAVSGWLAVWGLLRLVRTRTFAPFVIYRLGLALVIFLVLSAGWR